jgi:hypothetical protein
MQYDVNSHLASTAAKKIFYRLFSQIGMIILPAKVSQKNLHSWPAIQARKQSPRIGIGEMAVAALYPLFEELRVRPIFQHIQVMIGFYYCCLGLLQSFFHYRGYYSQISNYDCFPVPVPESKSYRICSIMRNIKSLYTNLSDTELSAYFPAAFGLQLVPAG